jgi:hypothetical protein
MEKKVFEGSWEREGRAGTNIISFVLREDFKELLQKHHEGIRHLIELVEIAIRVGVAESCADRLVHEEQVRKLVPRAVVVAQCLVILEPVGAHLHQGAVHRAAAGPAVEPYHQPLPVGDVPVVEEPEEEMAIMLVVDLDVTIPPTSQALRTAKKR